MTNRKALLIALWLIALAICARANVTMTIVCTNWQGFPDTNALIVQSVKLPINADGTYFITGVPRLYHPDLTGTVTITNMTKGAYMATNNSLGAILFAAPSGTGSYNAAQPGVAISGFNVFNFMPGVTSIDSPDGSITNIGATSGPPFLGALHLQASGGKWPSLQGGTNTSQTFSLGAGSAFNDNGGGLMSLSKIKIGTSTLTEWNPGIGGLEIPSNAVATGRFDSPVGFNGGYGEFSAPSGSATDVGLNGTALSAGGGQTPTSDVVEFFDNSGFNLAFSVKSNGDIMMANNLWVSNKVVTLGPGVGTLNLNTGTNFESGTNFVSIQAPTNLYKTYGLIMPTNLPSAIGGTAWSNVTLYVTAIQQGTNVYLSYTTNSAGGGGVSFPITNSMIAYWELEESGTSARINAYNPGTDNLAGSSPGMYVTNGIINNANYFRPGQGDSATHADDSNLTTGTNSFTITAWVWFDDTSAQCIVSKENAGSQNEFLLWASDAALHIQLIVYKSDSSTFGQSVTTASGVSASAWHFVAASFNTTNFTLSISVDNGTPATATSTDTTGHSTTAWGIGKRGGGQNAINGGRVDEVAYWHRVLTPTEITQVFNAQTQSARVALFGW